MYITCRKCGNDTFKITSDKKAECTKCGESFDLCVSIPYPPPSPEPLPPRKPQIYWFR